MRCRYNIFINVNISFLSAFKNFINIVITVSSTQNADIFTPSSLTSVSLRCNWNCAYVLAACILYNVYSTTLQLKNDYEAII